MRRTKGKSAPELIGSGALVFGGDPLAYIESLRHAKGITALTICRLLGRSVSWWSSKPRLTADEFVKILNALSVQVVLVPVDSRGLINPYPLPRTGEPLLQRDPERIRSHREKVREGLRSRRANAPAP